MCTHGVKVSFSISSMIRGYHEYKDVWEAMEEKELCPYENIFMSVDMTKAEQARHKLLVEQLKSLRARGKTDIIIWGDSIVTRSKSQRQQTEKQNSRSGSLEVMD